jgi:hypothetical protein
MFRKPRITVLIGLICLSLLPAAALAGIYGAPWKMHSIDNYFTNGKLIGADGTRLGDINGDGLPDIATGWEGGSATRVYINPGPEKAKDPWPAVTVSSLSGDVEDAFFVDLDGDGTLDVVSSCEGKTRRIFVSWGPKDKAELLNPEAWKTEEIPAATMVTRWMFGVPMDVDGKNGMDLIIGGKEKNPLIALFLSPENPRDLAAWKMVKIADCDWVMDMKRKDMDGDGDEDILYTDRATLSWLEYPGKDGDIEQPWKQHVLWTRTGAPHSLFTTEVDVDGDGLEDIICPLSQKIEDNRLLFCKRLDASGLKWASYTWGPYVDWFKALAVGDIDMNGTLDLVFTAGGASRIIPENDSGTIWVEIGPGLPDAPKLTFHDISGSPGGKYDLVVLLDLDGDGDLDVLTSEEAQKIADHKYNEGLGVFWYENPTK